MLKLTAIINILLLVILIGCVTPEIVRQGDEHLRNKDYIEAIHAYEGGLKITKDAAALQEIERKLAEAKHSFVDLILEKAARRHEIRENGSIAALDAAMLILREQLETDDDKARLVTQIRIYELEKEKFIAEIEQRRVLVLAELHNYEFADAATSLREMLVEMPGDKNLLESAEKVAELEQLYADLLEAVIEDNGAEPMLTAYEGMLAVSPTPLPLKDMPTKKLFIETFSNHINRLQEQGRWWAAYTLLDRWDLPELKSRLAVVISQGSEYFFRSNYW